MVNDKDDEVVRKLDMIVKELQDIKSTMKLYMRANRKELCEALNGTLNSSAKKIVYHLTDGEHSAHDISPIASVSMTSIHRWWADWERMGLISRINRNGRYLAKKNIALEEIGIPVPDINLFSSKNIPDEIPDKEKLKSILRDSSMFHSDLDLVEFAEKIFEVKISGHSYEDVIEKIVRLFQESPKMKQMMFLQALREQATDKGSSFKEYFEFWEKQIKSEI